MPLPKLGGDNESERKRLLPSIDDEMLPDLDDDNSDFSSLLPNLGDDDNDYFDEEKEYYNEEDNEETLHPVDASEDIYFEDEEEEEEIVDSVYREIPAPGEDFGKPSEEILTSPFKDEEPPKKREFIDREKKRLIPIGGERSKVKVDFRAKDYDHRKNRATFLKIVRGVSLLFILFLFGLGIKNTFFPEQIYTPEEIEQIALLSIGDTGFPLERGTAFVEEFFTYFLQADPEKLNEGKDPINKFLKGNTGEISGDADSNSNLILEYLGNRKKPQIIKSGPYVFQAISATESTGFYKVSALVANDPDKPDETHWVSFSINLYFDSEKGSISIASFPNAIPPYRISFNTQDIPEEDGLGNREQVEENLEKFTPTIDGYIKAYANSSYKNNKDILQYVVPNPSSALYSGFDGTVKLLDGDNSITKTIWKTEIPNEYVADVRVKWLDAFSEDTISYNGRYLLTLVENDEGVLLIKENIPYVYEEKVNLE